MDRGRRQQSRDPRAQQAIFKGRKPTSWLLPLPAPCAVPCGRNAARGDLRGPDRAPGTGPGPPCPRRHHHPLSPAARLRGASGRQAVFSKRRYAARVA